MILDNRALFSDKQAITTDDYSTSSYDLGAPGLTKDGGAFIQLKRNMSKGMPIPMCVMVNVDFTTGDGLTDLEIVLKNSDTVDGSGDVNGTVVDVFAITVPIASLKAGFVCPIEFLPRGITKRYLQFYYNVIGGTASAGKVTAGFVAAVDGSYQG